MGPFCIQVIVMTMSDIKSFAYCPLTTIYNEETYLQDTYSRNLEEMFPPQSSSIMMYSNYSLLCYI